VSRARRPIPFYYWPLWMATLAVALGVFYGILTPLWMLVRAVAWVSERPLFNRGRRASPRA
jgi:hypothetical protein